MARKKRKHESAAETLEEIQSLADRIADWVSQNPAWVLGAALAILIVAGGYGFIASTRESAAEKASTALAAVQDKYREAMGTTPDGLIVLEPANPETARQTRSDFLEKFRKVAEDHAGTAASALAWLEMGALQEALGQREDAITAWAAAQAAMDADEVGRALILVRMAGAYEEDGRWLEAGEAFERAAEVDRYPLRYAALADAARCFAEAGANERAVMTFDRVESEAGNLRVPEHIRSQLSELRARVESS